MSRLPYSYVGIPLTKAPFDKVTIEVFVDFFCPFSAKASPVLFQLAALDGVAVRVIPYPQPWHWEGGVIATCFNVVCKNMPDNAVEYYIALMKNITKFKEEGKKTSVGAIQELAFSLLPMSKEMKMKKETFMEECNDDESPGVIRMLKNQIKYGRTNAIHETPTYKVNGLVVGASSSWDLSKWKEFLKGLLSEECQ
mmetsp:Transcript_19694/g.38128  ORF Transcript_19694/g.38128 Transcript_19694/m.38128 type:complete len:196 (+) Transcript_19694:30-617(+)